MAFTDRSATVRSLGRIGNRGAVVREWVVRVLGAFGDSRAEEALIASLGDVHPAVRAWAARALVGMDFCE